MTVAETAELIMALKAHGRHAQAEDMLGWLAQFRDENGAYWMGMQVEEKVFWPVERPAWTSGAVILAHELQGRVGFSSRLQLDCRLRAELIIRLILREAFSQQSSPLLLSNAP